jgi:phospholipid-transporting ATPase
LTSPQAAEQQQFRVLKVNKFESSRKAMSVIVRAPNGKVYLYVKGSDQSIINMTRREDEQKLKEFQTQVDSFASMGLRTLAFGFREISLGDNVGIQMENEGAVIDSIDDCTPENVEKDITLLGCTGVEDLLFDNVAKCIEDFRKAKMKVWMLTGDKGITAK